MANTHEIIQTVNITSNQSSIDFNNIPQTYTDLKIMLSGRENGGSAVVNLTINGATTGYANKEFGSATLSVASSAVGTNAIRTDSLGNIAWNGAAVSVFSNTEYYIFNYTGSGHKFVFQEFVAIKPGNPSWIGFNIGSRQNTAAVTSLSLAPFSTSTFPAQTTATLYGIKNT